MEINESGMPTEETGMTYTTGRGYNETVKKVGNRFYYFDRFMFRWMPIKKEKVKFDKDLKESDNERLQTFEENLFESFVESYTKDND